jgi:hypothetical protein
MKGVNTGTAAFARMTLLGVVAVLVVGLPATFIGWYAWDSRTNRGYDFGYYGEYNRTSNALASIPGVAITQSWHHLDVTLEEFAFDAAVTGTSVSLYFGGRDPIRTMSRKKAVAALRQRIAAELSNQNTNR